MLKMNRLYVIAVVLLAGVVLGACATQPAFAPESTADFNFTTSQRAVMAPVPAAAPTSPPPTYDMMWAETAVPGSAIYHADSARNELQDRARRRIKIGHMSMETEDVEYSVRRFESYTEAFGGWVQSRNKRAGAHPSADLTLRIPAALYDEFVLIVSEFGHVRWFDDHVIDATAEYFDSQARLDINRAEEARLLEFIENSTSLEDIIMLESRLSEVRTNIELHENNIRRINRDVTYSTLYVNLIERGAPVIRPVAANLTTRMGDGFSGSITSVTSFFANIIVFMVYVSVPLILCGACAFVGVWFNRKRNRAKAF